MAWTLTTAVLTTKMTALHTTVTRSLKYPLSPDALSCNYTYLHCGGQIGGRLIIVCKKLTIVKGLSSEAVIMGVVNTVCRISAKAGRTWKDEVTRKLCHMVKPLYWPRNRRDKGTF